MLNTSRKLNWNRSRLGIERLETREVPASILVNTTLDIINYKDRLTSLREAIAIANATPETDTIVLKTGVYRLTLVGADDNGNVTGDLDVIYPVNVQGEGAANTIIEAGKKDRIVDVIRKFNVGFSNLTLRNGGGAKLLGGAIHAPTANVRLDGCVVSGCQAGSGGAVYAVTGNLTAVGTTFVGNSASDHGGAIMLASGSLTLQNSAVLRNIAGKNAGGLWAASATLTDSVVAGNLAFDQGGGIYGGTMTLHASSVFGNYAGSAGGGLFLSHLTMNNSTVSGNAVADSSKIGGGGVYALTATITNCTIRDNSAGHFGGCRINTLTMSRSTVSGNRAASVGGGIGAQFLNLTNCTISGNSSLKLAGGIYVEQGTISHCTITQNFSPTGAGVVVLNSNRILGSSVQTNDVSVKNSIIAQNHASYKSESLDVHGIFVSLGNNLIGDATGSKGFDAKVGDQVGTSESPLDARLGSLANNGGATMTHVPLQGSTAIDRGNNTGAPATDQRGLARIKDGDGNGTRLVDIGAVEV